MDDREPTPEFEQICTNVINNWRAGQLPFKDALAHITALNEEAAQLGHRGNHARAQDRLGVLQHYRGNLNTSIDHYNRARDIYSDMGNLTRIANIDLNQGENYRFKGDTNQALRLYRSAFTLAEANNLLDLQTLAILNEGLMLVDSRQDVSARRCLEKAQDLLDQWTEHGDLYDGIRTEIHHGLTLIALHEDDVDLAWEQALKVWEIAQQNPLPIHLGFANRVIGLVIMETNTVKDERFSNDPNTYFDTAIKSFREINAEGEVARTTLSQARYLAEHGDRMQAARKLQQIMVIFTRLGMVNDAALAAEAQRDLI